MSTAINSWTKEDFSCYLMIVAAAADGVIEEAEIEHIKETAGEATFEKMFAAFNAAMLAPALAYKNAHDLDADAVDEALHDAMSVYMADGDFDQSELDQFERLKKSLS
ncbi:MAG: TerB family tellurite resistance protein [Bacteroidia bacterium]|nr:TerB family tellurite resistance protein [Bacteroidia bacterium]